MNGPSATGRHALLHHLALGAQDVEELASFYAEVLGLRELARHQDDNGLLRSVWLDLGGAVLMIEHTRQDRPLVLGVDAGLFLIAFRVSHDEHAAIERHLADLGCPCEAATEYTRYFRDPEGNRFAISSYPVEY